jgi:diguanylate cyclase (GGDEF)-like protein/PAS domain S-box-containing protein
MPEPSDGRRRGTSGDDSGRPLTRILLLEDDPLDLELIEAELRRSLPSAVLDVASNRRRFLSRLRRAPPDVVLVDYSVPAYGGLAALRDVMERAPGTPVVVVTGSLDDATAANVIKAGAADYVLKDRLARLAPAIAAALDRWRVVGEKEDAIRALRESEERYGLAVRGANDGIWDWDLRTGRVYFSARWEAMLGLAAGTLAGHPHDWFDRVHPSDLPFLQTLIESHLAGEQPHLEVEHRVRHADGSYRWMLARGLAVCGPHGRPYRLAGSQTDISRRKAAEENLRQAALHDALTGLPNRALFWDRVSQAIGRASRGTGFAVLYIDMDQFKLVNDSLGHLAGDELLRALAARLEMCMRPGDTVARLGGDEFAALVEDVGSAEGALRVADRLHQELRVPFPVLGHDLRVSASIGVVADGARYQRPEDLLRDADTAMYRAKRVGRGGTEVFDASMHERAALRLKLETDLWRAVDQGELLLEYQPLMDLASGRLHGFEALVRWQHPQRGTLMPEEFVPLAEETGAIVGIGRWVLAEACRTAAAWTALPWAGAAPSISVNVSARQFARDDVLAIAQEAIARSGLRAGALCLELTESAVMEDPADAVAKLTRLKELGVGVAIDDFGTGYSSLSQLSRFPIDALKIDRSFVARLSARPEEEQIVRTIIALADHLHVATVAEGVETPRQKLRLRRLGCRYAQGFLFAPPLERGQAMQLAERHARDAEGEKSA